MFQRARPKSDQEENELVMASLRNLYEERQRNHQHTLTGDSKQVTFAHIYTTVPALFIPIMSYISITYYTMLVRPSLSFTKSRFLSLPHFFSPSVCR